MCYGVVCGACIWVCEDVHLFANIWRPKTGLPVSSSTTLFLISLRREGGVSLLPWTRLTVSARLTSLSPLPQCWGHRHTQPYPIFSVGAGNAYLGACACRASTLTHGAISLAPRSSVLVLIVVELWYKWECKICRLLKKFFSLEMCCFHYCWSKCRSESIKPSTGAHTAEGPLGTSS